MIPGVERQRRRWESLCQPCQSKLTCYICDHTDDIRQFKTHIAKDCFNAGTLIRYECPSCSVIFGDLRFLTMEQTEIDKDYEDLYSYYNESNTTHYINKVFSSLPEYLKDPSKKYVDYACGKWNLFVKEMKERGYDILGYDKYVKNPEHMVTNTLPLDAKFDVLINNNYIEHIIDPLRELDTMKSLVRPGGHIVFVTSCFEYVYEMTHYHTFFFNDKSMGVVCKKIGLSFEWSKKVTFADGVFTIAKVFKVL